MRISTTQTYTQGLKAFGDQQTKLARLQLQISTGQKLTKPSDDPAASARVLELEQIVSLNEQYQTNITQAENRLELEDSTLGSIENVMQRVRELVIQGNNSIMSDEARSAIADEIDERYKQLLSLANTTDENGDHLFAGYQNKPEPFTEQVIGSITQVQYNSDQGHRYLQISQSRQIDVSVNGSDLFMQVASNSALNEFTAAGNSGTATMASAHVFDQASYVPGDYQIVFSDPAAPPQTYDVIDLSGPTTIVSAATYTDGGFIDFQGVRTSITGTPALGDSFTIRSGQYQDVFSVVQGISETLRTAPTDTIRAANFAQALIDIDSSMDNLLESRTSIGGRLNALEAQQEDNAAFILATDQTLGTLRDTDLAEAISQLSLEQTILDAAQAVFSRITSSSLFNYLR
jgi:flagellar hook-associated protein 3 FlgL